MVCAVLTGMVHIKDIVLLIGKSSPCSGSSGFSLLLSDPLPYVQNVLSASLNKTFPSFLPSDISETNITINKDMLSALLILNCC